MGNFFASAPCRRANFATVQVCRSYQEDLLKAGWTVDDACLSCDDAGVLCRVGNHKSREAVNPLIGYKFTEFPKSVNETASVDGNSLGSIVLYRTAEIEAKCTLIASQPSSRHYFRGPPGCGKTVYMKLLGREFTKRKFNVFCFASSVLNVLSKQDFMELLDMFGAETEEQKRSRKNEIISNFAYEGKTLTDEELETAVLATDNSRIVILIDEVQENKRNGLWNFLLKSINPVMRRFIIIGFGDASLEPTIDAPFRNRWEPAYFLPNQSSIDAGFIDKWHNEAKKFHPNCSRNSIVNAIEWLLSFCGGQMYPFLCMCTHLIQLDQFSDAFDFDYFRSAEFLNHKIFRKIKWRCFDLASYDEEWRIALKSLLSGDIRGSLSNMGYWDNSSKFFVSELFLLFLFNDTDLLSQEPPPSLKDLVNKPMYILFILIVAGFRDLKILNFEESKIFKVEDAIAVAWGFCIRHYFPSLVVCPQAQAGRFRCQGLVADNSIDFSFNSLNVAVVITKNSCDIDNKLVEVKEKNKKWLNRCGILNIVTMISPGELPQPKAIGNKKVAIERGVSFGHDDERVFTYYVRTNNLFCGRKPVCIGVSCRGQTGVVSAAILKEYPAAYEISRKVLTLVESIKNTKYCKIIQPESINFLSDISAINTPE